jgi:chemotaxis protein methyltransferase CheR
MPLPLSPQLFAILGAFVEQRTGIQYGEADRDVFQNKISPRAEEAGFESLLDYYYFLKYDPAGDREMDALIEHLVVRETYLFREEQQLRTLVSRIIVPRVRSGHAVRVWSAACSTGEEPLTLATLLAEQGVLNDVEIVASDLSRRALARAREGRYGGRALRAVPDPHAHAPWLQPQPDGSVQVDPRLLARVDWRRLNLMDDLSALGSFDVILCRNVLIYFGEDTCQRLLGRLIAGLRPEGTLVVSVTESLLRFGTALECDEVDGVFFYRKART